MTKEQCLEIICVKHDIHSLKEKFENSSEEEELAYLNEIAQRELIICFWQKHLYNPEEGTRENTKDLMSFGISLADAAAAAKEMFLKDFQKKMDEVKLRQAKD